MRSPILFSAAPSKCLQNLARKARHTTPYLIIAEAIEELNVRPKLRSRYRLAPERALANVELFLEMTRAYDGRELAAFALAMRGNWDDAEALVEGRPDAEAESVSIITMHSAKGLEWPIVIPINSPPSSMTIQAFCTGGRTKQCISSSSIRPRPIMS